MESADIRSAFLLISAYKAWVYIMEDNQKDNVTLSDNTDKNCAVREKKHKREKVAINRDIKVCKRTSIGGQAVLEGVMMKGSRSLATAVRAPGGDITIECKYTKSAKERNKLLKLPFIRGVVNLVTQLFEGMGIIMRSAEVYGDFQEPSKFDKWVADKLKINPMSILMGFSVVLGVVIAVGLFVFLPNFLASLICDNIAAIAGSSLKSLYYSLIEGGIMLTLFLCYILFVTLMKDVRRVFMYHGAEHKVISCYERGLDLTVENAKHMPREHSRCGTTFLFIVVAVSIIVFVLINYMLDACNLLVGVKALDALIKLAFKLLFLPIVAGVSYELLKLLAKSDCLFVRVLRAPGMLLQKLTTKEPTDDMLEVSLAAFKKVLEMEENDNVPQTKFDISVPYGVARAKVQNIVKNADDSDIDWLFVEILNVKRSDLQSLKVISKAQFDNLMAVANKMSDGTPLQYALSYTEFDGVKISLNRNVLIPRQETEELVAKAVEIASSFGRKINALDLCTGSGAIAVSFKKRVDCDMMASDVSQEAIDVARANAFANNVKIDFVKSDMWASIDKKFDIIISNPPYIPTKDIASLDCKVRDFEPLIALDGGNDGLQFYRAIASGIDAHLEENGVLLIEFGIGQADDIKQIFDGYNVTIIKDINGIERIGVIRR